MYTTTRSLIWKSLCSMKGKKVKPCKILSIAMQGTELPQHINYSRHSNVLGGNHCYWRCSGPVSICGPVWSAGLWSNSLAGTELTADQKDCWILYKCTATLHKCTAILLEIIAIQVSCPFFSVSKFKQFSTCWNTIGNDNMLQQHNWKLLSCAEMLCCSMMKCKKCEQHCYKLQQHCYQLQQHC